MKKMNLFAVLVVFILAASFFTACPPEEEEQNDGVTYTLTITGAGASGNVSIEQGASATIGRDLTASDNSSTAGITFTYECTTAGHANCGVSVNQAGTSISVTASATVGDHAFRVSAVKDGATVATANFTVTVTAAAFNFVIVSPIKVEHGASDAVVPYTLTPNDKTGVEFSVTACKTHTGCGLSLSHDEDGNRRRYKIAEIASTVAVGDHAFTATATRGGETKTRDFTVNVSPKYTLTVKEGTYTVKIDDELDLSDEYTLTVSVGDLPEGVIVGIWCTSDYDFCDLLPDQEYGDLLVKVPEGASGSHGINMKAQVKPENDPDAPWILLAEVDFYIVVSAE